MVLGTLDGVCADVTRRSDVPGFVMRPYSPAGVRSAPLVVPGPELNRKPLVRPIRLPRSLATPLKVLLVLAGRRLPSSLANPLKVRLPLASEPPLWISPPLPLETESPRTRSGPGELLLRFISALLEIPSPVPPSTVPALGSRITPAGAPATALPRELDCQTVPVVLVLALRL